MRRWREEEEEGGRKRKWRRKRGGGGRGGGDGGSSSCTRIIGSQARVHIQRVLLTITGPGLSFYQI